MVNYDERRQAEETLFQAWRDYREEDDPGRHTLSTLYRESMRKLGLRTATEVDEWVANYASGAHKKTGSKKRSPAQKSPQRGYIIRGQERYARKPEPGPVSTKKLEEELADPNTPEQKRADLRKILHGW